MVKNHISGIQFLFLGTRKDPLLYRILNFTTNKTEITPLIKHTKTYNYGN
jgi:hypothetical protein